MAACVSIPLDVLHCVARQEVESFSPKLRVVSTLSQRKSGQGSEGHQRVKELRAPQMDRERDLPAPARFPQQFQSIFKLAVLPSPVVSAPPVLVPV